MAQIDVTELLTDPDFVDECTLIHRTTTVNTFGENVLTETPVVTVGSVQPASGKTLMRLPDALRSANVYSFWIKGEIVADGTSKYPDIISFKGKRYQVQTIFDWTNWGAGYSEGVAVAEVPIS